MRIRTVYLAVSACIIWFAVIFQFYLGFGVNIPPMTVMGWIVTFLSYFTIQTNMLCAACLTMILLKPDSPWGIFFSKARTQTAITVYIIVVGVSYSLLLRHTWNPQGSQKVVDELLHTVNPILFVGFWMFFVSKKSLVYKNTFGWLIYPFIYLIYVMIRGAIVHTYPYPFLDVAKVGTAGAYTYIAFITLGFVLTSVLLVFVSKLVTTGVSKD